MLSTTLCLSGHTPVAMLDHPAPDTVGAIGLANRLLVAVMPPSMRPCTLGMPAVPNLAIAAPSRPITRVFLRLLPSGRPA
ncbi:hypothetical protein D3C73_1267560 [compost metagenome]